MEEKFTLLKEDFVRTINEEPWKISEIFKEQGIRDLFSLFKIVDPDVDDFIRDYGYDKLIVSTRLSDKFKKIMKDNNIYFTTEMLDIVRNGSVSDILEDSDVDTFYSEIYDIFNVQPIFDKEEFVPRSNTLDGRLVLHCIFSHDDLESVIHFSPWKLSMWFTDLEIYQMFSRFNSDEDAIEFLMKYGKDNLIEASSLDDDIKEFLMNDGIHLLSELKDAVIDCSIRLMNGFRTRADITYLFEDMTACGYGSRDIYSPLYNAMQILSINIVGLPTKMKEVLEEEENVYDMITLRLWWNRCKSYVKFRKGYTSGGIIAIAKHFATETNYENRKNALCYLTGISKRLISRLCLAGYRYLGDIELLYFNQQLSELLRIYGFGKQTYNEFRNYFDKMYLKEEN